VEKIAKLFPDVIVEKRDGNGELKKIIDFDLLRQELSDESSCTENERYNLTWPGKKTAAAAVNAPAYKTLYAVKKGSADWDNTQNIYIEGDSIDALKILQENYFNKIKCIYIDPPYNTGKTFIYNDKFKSSKNKYSRQLSMRYDYAGGISFDNSELSGKINDCWLSMMYSRLRLARNLLRDDGVIFISIDDNEIHNLRKICDEIFGAGNFLGCFVINMTPNARDYGHIGKMHEYALFYAKKISETITFMLPDSEKKFKYSDEFGGFNIHPLYNSNVAFNSVNRPNLYYPFYLLPDSKIAGDFYEISLKKSKGSIEIYPPISIKGDAQFVWRWCKEKSEINLNKEIIGYKTAGGGYRIVQKMRTAKKLIRSLILDKDITSRKGTAEIEELFGKKIFSFPKPLKLIYNFCKISLGPSDIVLDFFAGSATTAHAVMKLNAEDGKNRKYIIVQLPEKLPEDSEAYKAGYKNICEIGRERIRRAAKKIQAETGAGIDYGFRLFKII